MHLTGGILRHFRAFSTPEQNPALGVLSTPAHPQVTQTVGLPLAQQRKKIANKKFAPFICIEFLSNFRQTYLKVFAS